ncbi:MAG: small subunit ribosomal protein S10 [Parcubacteria group bacterium Gr01-1014_2]|nr:MAG: small subunit ribosomal protein S10 [Parcubacteria group bacterium Gr01-1014_2]
MPTKTKKEKPSFAKASKGEEDKNEQRIRIRLKAFDSRIIDKSAKQIIETLEKLDVKAIGPVPLPTEISKFTVNRSTFVHKDSREQFEMRIHKRLIEIPNPSSKTIDALQNLSLPAGVDIEIKM